MSMTPVSDNEGRGPRDWGPFVAAASAAVLGVVTAGIALLVLIAIVLAGIGNSISHAGERPHLKAIPISSRACPYVSLMHTAANDFQAHEPAFGFLLDANHQMVPMTEERAIVDPPLARFEFAIAVSGPHFPAAVRAQLAITQDAAHQGRAQLARATDPMALASSTNGLLSKGKQAFGYASDLVGTQCGHGLGADSQVGPYLGPIQDATTTTASRS
jgi:hypothetical protein